MFVVYCYTYSMCIYIKKHVCLCMQSVSFSPMCSTFLIEEMHVYICICIYIYVIGEYVYVNVNVNVYVYVYVYITCSRLLGAPCLRSVRAERPRCRRL